MADPSLSLIVAGPILRRVEPMLVAVWVALREPRSVRLTVFEGQQQAGTGTTPFTGGTPWVVGAANTLRAGDKLHLAVVVADEFSPTRTLTPGKNYSYNVGFGPFVRRGIGAQAAKLDPAEVDVSADLRSLRLLSDQPIDNRPHKALGYVVGELPGFSLPPPSLTDLRILHGSCRRPAHVYPDDEGKNSFDGLAWVDDLIQEWRRGSATALPFDPNVRPHQLFLTGDQIYADDVHSSMLPMLNTLGNQLIGGPELLPTRYPPNNNALGKERYVAAPKQPGFDTTQAFVDAMKNQGKDALAELKKDRRVRVLADPCFDRGFRLVYARPYNVDPGVVRDSGESELVRWPADLRHFPAALREPVMQCEAQFTSVDLKDHLMSFGEYCAMYAAVWTNAVWPIKPDGKPALTPIGEVYKRPSGVLPQIWELHACYPDENRCIGRNQTEELDKYLTGKATDEKSVAGYKKLVEAIEAFYDSLPRVRRALANVPTYMMFDDHDVTDDWNLGRAWRDRVYTAPLGRRIITTSLVAYALFQDWGNDPKRYRTGPFRKLLEHATVSQPAAATGPTLDAQTELEKLFGLNQQDPEVPAPQLKWHFSIDGPRHRVIATDTRTRRVFRSRYLPAGLLSRKALDEQLPDPALKPLPSGVEVLIVISATAPVLPSLAARAILPLSTRMSEFTNHAKWRNLTGINPDNEIWPGDDVAYEDFLRRLAEYKKVVVLSGEVHYAAVGELSYWKRGLKRFTLAEAREADLNRKEVDAQGRPTETKFRRPAPALRTAFQTAGFTLSDQARLSVRDGNDEWIVVDPAPAAQKMFLVRKESDGLNVFEEEEPARIAQFVSSGLKNVEERIHNLGRWFGFAFPLADLTPAERLVWLDNTPAPVKPPDGVRLRPPVRDRLGREPVLLPTAHWPAGTKLVSRPDFAWRADAVRDERPDAERPEFVRPRPLPAFDPNDVPGTYGLIADIHGDQMKRFRFNRGVLYQCNLGLVRFELDGQRIVARQDFYAHEPGRHEAVLVNVYRVPLQPFGEERPRLVFDLPRDNA